MASGLFTLKNQLVALIQNAWSGNNPSNAPKYLEYLVVAGGGGAGFGGAGSGGVISGLTPITKGASYYVTVGAGGAVGSTPTNGANSVLIATSSGASTGNLVASGGGASGGTAANGDVENGYSGGSGGGGGYSNNAGGQGIFGQGNAGSNGTFTYPNYVGGGGGGAGTVGLAGIYSTTGGNGGAGIASAISGTVTTYAGGGGAGGHYDSSGTPPLAGSGGIGGGGTGGRHANSGFSNTSGISGSANTGGGGGGGWSGTGATGGSGIVIVRYSGNTCYFSGGTVSYISGYVVHTFTSSGTLAPLTSPTVNGPTNFLSRSLRLRSSASAYLSRTPSSTGSTQKLTYSTWVKRGITGAYSHFGLCAAISGSSRDAIRFTNGNAIDIYFAEGGTYDLSTSAVFVDPSAWYHIVVAIDTTQATASNRVILYVNNQQITLSGTQPVQNYNFTGFNVSGKLQAIGENTAGSLFYDGELADIYLIDGQQLTPSSFGYTDPITNVWQPISYSGTYGTNGFHLPFTDNSALTTSSNVGLGADTSGNGNYFATNNISITAGSTYDSMTDVPTISGASSNYCVLNPLFVQGVTVGTLSTLTNGNLYSSSTAEANAIGTIAVSTGKWYFELTNLNSLTNNNDGVGIYQYTTGNYYAYRQNGNLTQVSGNTAYGSTWTAASAQVIGVALDMNAGTLTFYLNNTSQGTAVTGLTGAYFPFTFNRAGGGSSLLATNFGQQPFVYTPPSGYVALNTYNLPAPTIVNGGLYMNAVPYTGNGNATAQAITGVGFKPDFVWLKARSASYEHILDDSNRGAGKILYSSLANAESTVANFVSFDSDGFTVNANGGASSFNENGTTYISWNWKAGQAFNNTNSNGSIISTVNVNTTAGFSIVTYTNASSGTVGHGLGVAPAMVIYKSRSSAYDWVVLHQSLTNMSGYYLKLNTTDAVGSGLGLGGNPTSSVIYTNSSIMGSGASSLAYCFAQIDGFSAFGSYTGNGSTNGPFVFCGFRPVYVLVKRSSSAGTQWQVLDTKRSTYNSMINAIYASSGVAEFSDATVGINSLSNGFKIAGADGNVNTNNATYIYMAFAENPFKYANAR